MKIGFIGLGVMGRPMASNLVKNGFEVYGYARNKAHLNGYNDVVLLDSIEDLVNHCDVILTIVGFPSDVSSVYEEIDKYVRKGMMLVDMTTSSPTLAKKLHEHFKLKGVETLDCPVTGGDLGAKNGTLTMFVGGNEDAYLKLLPVFKAMGSNICYVGEAGNGQHAKLANQIAIAGAVGAMSETVAYLRRHNMDVKKLVDVIATGSASSWQLKNMAPRALNGDIYPGFYIKHFVKDMKLAKDECNDLNVLNTVLKMYEQMIEEEKGELGTQAIVDFYK
ncbi:MAG: NAD(P)-dependent oxidoreductase [Bacilli bacterium]|nr:NAD(P)-dependent oxidoreductase [Bacilli bacterium]